MREFFYSAYEKLLEQEELVENRLTYTGQQWDNETEQYYLRARCYNPIVARFAQEDAYRGDGLNLYAYCANNPVMYCDPSGYSNEGKCWSKENPFELGDQMDDYTKKVRNRTKVLGTYKPDDEASDILRGELKDAKIKPPPYGNAAHHIVAHKDKRAAYARKLLDKFGIDYNSAANGVFLPYLKNDFVTSEILHIGNHGPDYMKAVNKYFKNLVKTKGNNLTKENVVDGLDYLRKMLLTGKLKLN